MLDFSKTGLTLPVSRKGVTEKKTKGTNPSLKILPGLYIFPISSYFRTYLHSVFIILGVVKILSLHLTTKIFNPCFNEETREIIGEDY